MTQEREKVTQTGAEFSRYYRKRVAMKTLIRFVLVMGLTIGIASSQTTVTPKLLGEGYRTNNR